MPIAPINIKCPDCLALPGVACRSIYTGQVRDVIHHNRSVAALRANTPPPKDHPNTPEPTSTDYTYPQQGPTERTKEVHMTMQEATVRLTHNQHDLLCDLAEEPVDFSPLMFVREWQQWTGYSTEHGVRATIYAVAKLCGVPKTGDFAQLVRHLREEALRRGYRNISPTYLADPEDERARSMKFFLYNPISN